MKARQFLNVVMQRYGSVSSYAVSRIKPEEHLFYRSTAEARAAAKSKFNMEWPSSAVAPPWMESISRMPPPRLGFERSISDDKRLDFLPFYEPSIGGASKILCVDAAGHTVLYDMDDGSLQPIPCLNSPKGSRPICFSTTNPDAPDPERADVFYLMGRYPVSCNPCNFEALMYSDPSNGGRLKGWHWHRLPSPPAYVDERPIICHALLHIEGDSILVISSGGEPSLDTYCFHTASRRWFKAGPWKLPFYNRAVHVPELDNLLFGVDNDEHNFCAMGVSPLRSDSGPPLVYSWPDLDLPEDWRMLDCSFVYLGAGRFCITKVFEFGFNQRTGNPTDTGAVMSGVEVVRHKKSGLVMVNHRSKFYKFIMDDIQCVL